jgi:ribosomal protein S12 methylthiotransferase
VGFISLGCAKNLVDAQLMAGNLIADGISLAPSPEEADVVLVNTCSFIKDARDESYDSIESACEMKRAGQCSHVVVTGCLSQRYRNDLLDQMPDVDAFVGLDELEDVGTVIRRIVGGENRVLDVSQSPTRLYDPKVSGIVFTGGPYAYLKVAEGCNHLCSFCAIPGIRGTHRSRPMASIVKEAEDLLEMGYRELNLISQDITFYGRDLDSGNDLPALLRELGKIGGHFWIRLLYGYPSHVTDELLEAMGDVSQVCHYLDLPIQHSHPDILKGMKRTETADSVRDMGPRIRSFLPDGVLRTTCLLGFPGETEDHFNHLLDYVQATEFDHLGAFVFSPEDGTPALDMPDRPDAEVAESRRSRLMICQLDIVDRKLSGLIGREDQLILEHPEAEDETSWIGRTPRFAPEVDGEVLVRNVKNGRPGAFVPVRYTAQVDYDMEAEQVGNQL